MLNISSFFVQGYRWSNMASPYNPLPTDSCFLFNLLSFMQNDISMIKKKMNGESHYIHLLLKKAHKEYWSSISKHILVIVSCLLCEQVTLAAPNWHHVDVFFIIVKGLSKEILLKVEGQPPFHAEAILELSGDTEFSTATEGPSVRPCCSVLILFYPHHGHVCPKSLRCGADLIGR